MVIDEYLKFKPVGQVPSTLSKDCALNTPSQLKQSSCRLPPLKASTSVESLQPRVHSNRDEEMQSGGDSLSALGRRDSQKSKAKRRNIDISRLFKNDVGVSYRSSSTQLSKQFDATNIHHSLLKSETADTTLADTLLGTTTMEDASANNTTMFRSLHESQIGGPQTMFNQSLHMKSTARHESPTDVMVMRWKQGIEKGLPAIDLIDLAAEHDPYYAQKRQFAPEYSQMAYLAMLEREFAIGDYLEFTEGELSVSS